MWAFGSPVLARRPTGWNGVSASGHARAQNLKFHQKFQYTRDHWTVSSQNTTTSVSASVVVVSSSSTRTFSPAVQSLQP